MSGIYEIKNKINGHIYIGSSNNLATRKYNHYYLLRHNKHHSKYLQRAWNKYGEAGFIFNILLECDKDTLLEAEQKFLDELRPEYNIAVDAKAPTRGFKFSVEHNRKLSERLKGHPPYLKHHSEETKKRIGLASKGRRMTDDQKEAVRIRMLGNKNGIGNKGHTGIPSSLIQKQRVSEANSKYYGKLISPAGEIYAVTNLYKFCKENNLGHTSMRCIFSGERKTHKGWKLYDRTED